MFGGIPLVPEVCYLVAFCHDVNHNILVRPFIKRSEYEKILIPECKKGKRENGYNC